MKRSGALEYIEAVPLPLVCQKCEAEGVEFDCGSCEYGGLRWTISRKDELRLSIKLKEKTIARLEKELATIRAELEELQ